MALFPRSVELLFAVHVSEHHDRDPQARRKKRQERVVEVRREQVEGLYDQCIHELGE